MQICLMFLVITDDSIVWMYVTFQNENVFKTFSYLWTGNHCPLYWGSKDVELVGGLLDASQLESDKLKFQLYTLH